MAKSKVRSKYNPRVFSFRRHKHSIGLNSCGEVHRDGEYLLPGSELTAFEEGIVHGVTHLQELNCGFARVWGGAEAHRAVFNLSVEFILFDDDKEGWKEIRAWIKRMGGIENQMDHCRHLDKTKLPGAKRWKLGKDHGRWETQIDVTWDVTHRTKSEVAELIASLKASCINETRLWQRFGMSVS